MKEIVKDYSSEFRDFITKLLFTFLRAWIILLCWNVMIRSQFDVPILKYWPVYGAFWIAGLIRGLIVGWKKTKKDEKD